jgi:hypothetical protein
MLAAIPVGYRALVVDNNSTDDTAAVAGRHGVAVVTEPRPGTARQCTRESWGGDADGSMDPGDTLRSQANIIAQMTVIADGIAV